MLFWVACSAVAAELGSAVGAGKVLGGGADMIVMGPSDKSLQLSHLQHLKFIGLELITRGAYGAQVLALPLPGCMNLGKLLSSLCLSFIVSKMKIKIVLTSDEIVYERADGSSWCIASPHLRAVSAPAFILKWGY